MCVRERESFYRMRCFETDVWKYMTLLLWQSMDWDGILAVSGVGTVLHGSSTVLRQWYVKLYGKRESVDEGRDEEELAVWRVLCGTVCRQWLMDVRVELDENARVGTAEAVAAAGRLYDRLERERVEYWEKVYKRDGVWLQE